MRAKLYSIFNKICLENVTDVLICLWGVLSFIVWNINQSSIADLELFKRLIVISIYFICRLLLQLNFKFQNIILIVISILYLYEICIGYLQLFNIIPTNDSHNLLLGTFKNSGPYGGFIAICITMFIVAYYQNKNRHKIISHIFLVLAIIGLIILPSIRSRSAILAMLISLFVYFYREYKNLIKRYSFYP